MAMYFFAEKLLEREIQEMEWGKKGTLHDPIIKLQYQKELEVLRRLQVELCDMTGDLDDVKNRLEDKCIYFMDPDEFNVMKAKASKYDYIKKIMEEG